MKWRNEKVENQKQKINYTSIGGLSDNTLSEFNRLKLNYQVTIKRKINNDEFMLALLDSMELYMK